MIPLVPIALAICAFAGAIAVLRSYGPRYRVGRLLATTPRVTVAEARDIAIRRQPRYVRIEGRIDAEDEFEDHDHRPLVFRRRRFEAQRRGRWVAFEDERQSVPFQVNEGLDSIAIDADALDHGLVVVPRESAGRAEDLAERAPDGIDAETPVRLRIDQVSSVEHAAVLGLPIVRDGEPVLSAGLGRPLILTTLEDHEAMRIIAESATRPRLVVGLLASGALLLTIGVAWAVLESVS